MNEIRYPSMDYNVLLAQMEKQELLRLKSLKKAQQKLARERRNLERDDVECEGVFSYFDHMSNIDASNELLRRLQFFHGYHGDNT